MDTNIESKLIISDLRYMSSDELRGKIKNESDTTVYFVRVKFSLMSNGRVLETMDFRPIGNEGLEPGEVCRFGHCALEHNCPNDIRVEIVDVRTQPIIGKIEDDPAKLAALDKLEIKNLRSSRDGVSAVLVNNSDISVYRVEVKFIFRKNNEVFDIQQKLAVGISGLKPGESCNIDVIDIYDERRGCDCTAKIYYFEMK